MDRSWIHEPNRFSEKFLKGLYNFILFAKASARDGRFACPCQKCVNMQRFSPGVVSSHILQNGFSPGYTDWIFHRDPTSQTSDSSYSHQNDDGLREVDAQEQHGVQQFLEDMAVGYDEIENSRSRVENDWGDSSTIDDGTQPTEAYEYAKRFHDLLEESDEELFSGCRKHSKLSFILELYNKKCMYGWSDKSFEDLLTTMRETLPEGEKLPESSYEVRKLIDALGLDYQTIDACPNDCMLFWKEHIDEPRCLHCNAYRYKEETESSSTSKRNKIRKGVKVLRWFPLIPRLQRLFMCKKTASLMRWHFDERRDDGYLRHPADARAWKDFDSRYADFAKEPRNVRLGLATDGFNPFRSLSSTHSSWPVVVTAYNLPPWLCMKQSSLFLCLLIPGPKSPGANIDIYLEPFIEELIHLWEKGVDTYDAHAKTTFKLHASLLWTINDFPAYSMLSGWRTKKGYGCPCCGFNTWSKWLTHGNKYCFLGHRRFLSYDHSWRRNKKCFDGTEELRGPPVRMTGSCIRDLWDSNGSTRDLNGTNINITEGCNKKSIFFRLPYWEYNRVRHNLDVMHIEKNVCDNILDTLLSVRGKTKDNLKARFDMQEMGIRRTLHPFKLPTGKYEAAPALFEMSSTEKKQMLRVLKHVKVPDGYSSNISRCVDVKHKKISGLKSHDCHVLLHDLLPVAVRGCLKDRVARALIDLSAYFRELSSKVLKVSRLEEMEVEIGEILARMEMIFPPSFFTIMVHLVVHLVEEAKWNGPVQYRWMYPIERYLMTLKAHVGNKAYPEASIAQWYIANEAITFCSRYFEGVRTRFNKPARNSDDMDLLRTEDSPVNTTSGHPIGKVENIILDPTSWVQAHRYVLYNSKEVLPYIEEHKDEIKRKLSSRNRRNNASRLIEIEKVHHSTFVDWFKGRVARLEEMHDPRFTAELKGLARGPNYGVRQFKGYITKGVRYHANCREEERKTQNSGVVVATKTSSLEGEILYYGRIIDMIELNYFERFRVALFKCEWVDVERGRGLKKDAYGYTMVNFSRLIHTGSNIRDEPFVFADQVRPVFYIKDSQEPDWYVALRTKPRDTYELGDELVYQSKNADQSLSVENAGPASEDENWVRNDLRPVAFEYVDPGVAATTSVMSEDEA
ncbi:unnamed protein product [Linum tenue]|uniref:Transposase n=1 Tax=Linum tenue TaxID=586396 RepID=A0AAV0IGR3_9ROSI|nr:unnamed protein product [Linum tenue]